MVKWLIGQAFQFLNNWFYQVKRYVENPKLWAGKILDWIVSVMILAGGFALLNYLYSQGVTEIFNQSMIALFLVVGFAFYIELTFAFLVLNSAVELPKMKAAMKDWSKVYVRSIDPNHP